MLQKRPTYEELLKETMTHRLKIIPERQRRTQQGLLIEDVDFDDFDLNNHYKKALTIDEATQTNEAKGTQTDFIVGNKTHISSKHRQHHKQKNTRSTNAERQYSNC